MKGWERTVYCGQVKAAHGEKTVTLCGWVDRRRDLGGLIFVHLRDREGVVQVGLRVEANGQLSRLRLIASSGHALLDRAALLSLGRVEPLTDSIGWLNGRQIDMILPVRYQLIDS